MSCSQWDRRQFLTRTAATFAAGFGASTALEYVLGDDETATSAPAVKNMNPIIDTHQHLWDLSMFQLPWLKGNPTLNRSFLMSDYLKATEGLNIVKTVYMEVDVEPSQQGKEAAYVLALIRKGEGPMAGAVISGRPNSDGFQEYMTRFKDVPAIKGVRQVLHSAATPQGYALDEWFLRGVRLLGDLDKSFDICMRPGELGDAVKLVDACPGTRFVLDHCGNANVRSKDRSVWRDGLAKVAERSNVVACKVSGIVASAAPDPWTADDLAPIVNHVLDRFGPDRVVFGGDWPVCTLAATYRQWFDALTTIVSNRAAADQKKLFHDNAQRIYRLA
ncbi:MAG: amidohydrolase family protein [Isosphaeraceae bacterium]